MKKAIIVIWRFKTVNGKESYAGASHNSNDFLKLSSFKTVNGKESYAGQYLE